MCSSILRRSRPRFFHPLLALISGAGLIAYACSFASAQTNEEPAPQTQQENAKEETESAVQTDWRDQIGVLQVGYLGGPANSEARAKLEPFRQYLEERTGLEVVMQAQRTWGELVDQHVDRRIQYVIHSATSFAAVISRCKCIEPLGMPVRENGQLGIYSVILSASGQGVRSINDLNERTLAISRAPSVAGRVIALRAVEELTVSEENFRTKFLEVNDPSEAVSMVLKRRADAAVGWSSLEGDKSLGYNAGTLRIMIDQEQVRPNAMRVIWQSELLPFGPHAIRSDAPTELKEILRNSLMDMQESAPDAYDVISPIFGGGFKQVETKAYQPFLQITGAIE